MVDSKNNIYYLFREYYFSKTARCYLVFALLLYDMSII